MSLEIKDTNVANKILQLEKYLKQYEKSDLKEGKGIEKDNINEDELVEISDEFKEFDEKDEEKIEKALDSLQNIMDLDEDGELSNEELKKFQDILDETGISFSNLVELYQDNENALKDEIEAIDVKEIENLDLDGFVELISKYPLLNEAIKEAGYEEVYKLLDSNGDNKIDLDEIGLIVDKDPESLTFSDIKTLIDDNLNVELTEEDEKEIAEVIDTLKGLLNNTKDASEVSIPDSLSYSSPMGSNAGGSYSPVSGGGGSYNSGGGGSYNSGGGSYNSGGSSSVNSSTSTSGDTIEELESKKDEKTTELNNLNSTLEKAYDGTDSDISSKKEDMDTKEEEYKKLLDEEAENNEEVKTLKTNLEAKEKDLDKNEESIKETDVELNETNSAISDKNNEISGLKSDKSALESALNSVKSTTVTENNKSEIESKKASLEAQIKEKGQAIQKAEGELKDLEDKKTELETSLESLNKENDTLKSDIKGIEEDIKQTASKAVKEALEAYQTSRDTFEEAKEAKITSTKTDIEKVQSDIDELEVKIQELNAEKIKAENQISPWGQYNEQRGQTLANAANSLYGGVSKGGGYCARGVSQAIQKAFGYATSGNGCDYGNVLSKRDDWVEITDTISSASELSKLPAGAIVSWSPYNTKSLGSIYGHVYIADGKGHEISDFKGNISTYYADRGGKYRVFLPT